MSRISYFQNVFFNVLDRKRIFRSTDDKRDINTLCSAILSEKGEVSGVKLAANILSKFDALSEEEKRDFFFHILNNYDLDSDAIIEAAEAYKLSKSDEDFLKLSKELEPKTRQLLRRVNQTPGATYKLVKMREELLSFLKAQPRFKSIDANFEYLFSSWFNRGFLNLQPIDWNTPANILEKIIEYEAVHTINDWDDLRRRLQPEDRRCFAFFHPVMPDEPLIFVEVALTNEIPESVNSLLAENRDAIAPNEFNTAVFYSISNCQKGLKGISFGNFLIKQVVNDLSQEFPGLKNFVTLSPIPGFMRWLEKQDENLPRDIAIQIESLLSEPDMTSTPETLEDMEKPLRVLLAKYMVEGKNKDGWPVDPVARFHLGNGASLMRFNWMADITKNGLKQSACMMVNYKYDLETVEDNHESYVHEKVINTSREIKLLAKQ